MDNVTDTGIYRSTGGSAPANVPAAKSYVIVVINAFDNIVQTCFSYNDGDCYFRVRHNNGTWYGWFIVTKTEAS